MIFDTTLLYECLPFGLTMLSYGRRLRTYRSKFGFGDCMRASATEIVARTITRCSVAANGTI